MFHFFKALLSLNDTKLLETLLSKDFYMLTLGALECKICTKKTYFCIDDPDVVQG